MAFRRSIPQAELRDKLTTEQRAKSETTYQASRGGWHKPVDKPVAGTPKQTSTS